MRIAIDAPKDVAVLRKELKETGTINQESVQNTLLSSEELTKLQRVLSASHEQREEK